MNKVILSGRFTRDPESRMTQGNMEISRFSLACDYGYTKDGKLTEFVNCVAFGKTAETINRYCKKGIMVVALGRIKNNSYEAQDGTKRYATDVIIESFEFVSSVQGKNESEPVQTPDPQVASVSQTESDPYTEFSNDVNINFDDLPF